MLPWKQSSNTSRNYCKLYVGEVDNGIGHNHRDKC